MMAACGSGGEGDTTGSQPPADNQASGGQGDEQQPTGQTIQLPLGVLGPMSGGAAAWGIHLERSARMFAEKIEAEGGLKVGDNTYTFTVIAYDHKSSPAEAATAANRLVHQDGVKYIPGNAVGATCDAAQTVTEPAKVMSFFICWGKENTTQEKPFSFRTLLGPWEAAPAMYHWIAENRPEIKRVAVISPNDTSGVDTASGAIQAATTEGLEIVAEEYYERGTQDFIAPLTRLLASNPDLIELAASPAGEGSLILQQLRNDLGYTGPITWTALLDPAQVIELAGAAADGVFSTLAWNLESEISEPILREWAQTFREKYNEPATLVGAANYAALEIVATAMQQAGSVDTEEVLRVIEATDTWDTVLGPVVIGGEEVYGINRQFLYPMVLTEIQGGQSVEVARLLPPELQ